MSASLKSLENSIFGGIYEPCGRCHYGGQQGWFEHKWQRDTCCGSIAAANMLAYMAFQNPQYRLLYAGPDIGKACFCEHQLAVLKYVHPIRFGKRSIGIHWPGRLKRGALAYARSKGIALKAHILHKYLYSKHSVLDTLANALSQDMPVAMAVHFNKMLRHHESGNCFDKHWVTITGISYGDDGKPCLTVSSWNKKYELDFDTVWHKSSYVGFIYLS